MCINKYAKKIEDEELYVLRKNTVQDDEGTYCIMGRKYKVLDMKDDCFLIELDHEEVDEMEIKIDDSDFEIVIL